MWMLLIEYKVDEYASWKAMFDQDPMGRREHGVTRYRILRDPHDSNHLMVSLEFSSAEEANNFRKTLQPVWEISGAGRAWVLKEAEEATY
jgi:hypothetical protein